MSIDKHYIDLSAEKCISIDSRHILILRKSDGAFCQGRPINAIEGAMTDEIVSLRAELAQLRAQAARVTALEAALREAQNVIERCSAYIGSIDHGENTKSYMMCDAWLRKHTPQAQPATEAQHEN